MHRLERLAELAGIEPVYRDIRGKENRLDADAQRALLSAMGFAVATADDVEQSLRLLEERPWRRLLEPVTVLAAERQPGAAAVSAPVEAAAAVLHWIVTEEQGEQRQGRIALATLPLVAARTLASGAFERRRLALPALPEGYHRLSVRLEGGPSELSGDATLIVAPPACYSPDEIAPGARWWGVAAQLYGLRSARNWGIGDFTDLTALVDQAAQLGAATVGLNPLHPLFPANPDHCSPYSPTSRALLNTLYIDVTAVPEFAEAETAQALWRDSAFQRRLTHLRAAELVDYEGVATLKYLALGCVFAHFRRYHLQPGTARATAFRRFCAERGPTLERLALFDALHEHFLTEDAQAWRWRDWSVDYQRADSPAVAAFADARRERIEFFNYLQWLAHEQLTAVVARAEAGGLALGLYLDLAVGVDPAGSDAWGEPGLFASAGMGAPPDMLNRLGQNWGLAPFNPLALREQGYAPFIDALRSSMRYASAIRIDHVMGLARLYWIPPGLPPTAGAYVRYPLPELLRVVALESRRNRCLVIGEDLGTVPDGFRDTMAAAGLLSYKVLYFERSADGGFSPPQAYPEQSLVTISTHDLPPLGGWWTGRDIDWRVRLGLYPNEDMQREDIGQRPQERRRLLDALVAAGVLDRAAATALERPGMSAALLVAVHRLLARSPGRLLLTPLEDALGQEEQANLPGTTTEHPNWRRKSPVALERLAADERLQAVAAALREERPATGAAPTT